MVATSTFFQREGRRQRAVGLGLGEQRVRLCLERLHGIGTRGEPSWWFFERDERDERVRRASRRLRFASPSIPFHAVTISLVLSAASSMSTSVAGASSCC